MPSSKSFLPPTISQIYAKAMCDSRPTKTITSQKQLAYALGYPMDWRVERTVVVECEGVDGTTKSTSGSSSSSSNSKGKRILRDRIHALGGKKNQTKYMWLNHEAAQKAAVLFEKEGTLDPKAVDDSSNKTTATINTNTNTNTNTNANANTTGSHLLPPTALYKKGDIVQVNYDNKWWSATVTKRPKKKNDDEFFYSVMYHGDDATQDEISEEDLRPGEDPSELAVSLGFDANWSASRKGSRFIIVAPCGKVFQSKKAATKHFRDGLRAEKAAAAAVAGDNNVDGNGNGNNDDAKKKKKRKKKDDPAEDVGDPPWRVDGHDLIRRKVVWTFQHKASARRQIKIEQTGTIVGYIDESDTDKDGNPGFVSEKTGKPANLFHVVFDDSPRHAYAQYLLNNTDLEEYEILDCLLPQEEEKVAKSTASSSGEGSPSKKKRRRR